MQGYEKIKNVIFDFGGVILDIDYKKTEDALRSLMKDGDHAGFSQAEQADLFNGIETGHLSEAEFRNGLRELCERQELSDLELDRAWNALLGPVIPAALDLVRQVSEHRRVFLLSNTNKIHLDFVKEGLVQDFGSVDVFESSFEKVYYSHEHGLRKPHPEIFQLVLDENNLEPTETLFIDDSQQHIVGANRLGIKTLHLLGPLAEEIFLLNKIEG